MRRNSFLKWVVAPLVVAVLAAAAGVVGRARSTEGSGSLALRAASLSESERLALEKAPALAIGNATWALGTADAVKQISHFELDHLSESEGARRARVFMRFGMVDTNPDGQAALFNQACVADPRDCDHLKEAAERETRERLVAPGNSLPLFFVGGHPRVSP